MIKKLQKKFILSSMAALFVILALTIAIINIVNYTTTLRQTDEILDVLTINRGRFPAPGPEGGGLPHDMSPETPYETRFFSVMMDHTTGTVICVETSRIVSVSTSTAIQMAQDALLTGDDRGFVDSYRFCLSTDGNTAHIIFLDCGRRLDSFRGFLLSSIAIALAGLFLVFVVVAVASSRVIRPISESYEKQKRFITDAGHELKTPLTIIHADADVLELELGENEWVTDIQKQVSRLSALTRDLVFLARMEEGIDPVSMVDLPLSDLVAETCQSFHALALTQDKTLMCNVQPMLSMKGRESDLQQLVTILLDNALKYSPSGGEITLSLDRQGKQLRLMANNPTTAPLPEGELNQLFERFYRTDSSRNTLTGGYGIGLSVARAIVTAHGGKIQALSRDGHSLQIQVLFPTA